jgi:ABC-2 type transport system ATP-binding protein
VAYRLLEPFMIDVVGLTKYYGHVPAILDVSFSVNQGEIIGFLGPNGAGKTTTMRILTGFSPATRGTAKIAGFDINKDPIEVKRRVGYLPENVPLYGEMITRKFLKYVADVKGVAKGRVAGEVGRVMELAGLTHMADRLVKNLSRGYRQRVGLAQALIGDPPVLIMDEPTVGLDPQQIIEIRHMIKQLAQEHTVLLSTHILPEVSMLCERVLIIHQGRLVAQDSLTDLVQGSKRKEFLLQVLGPELDVARVLKTVEGVAKVKARVGNEYLVITDRDTVSGEMLAKAIVGAGFGLGRLEARARNLEDIFVDAITSEPAAAEVGALQRGGA